MAKKCPPGKYYCFDDKKCKKIPRGYRIGARGYLARDTKDDDNETKKNGNGNSNGNGNGGNGSGNGNGGSSGNGGGNGGGGVSEDVEYNYPNVRRNRRFSTGMKMSMNPATGMGAKKSTKNNPDGDDIRNSTYNQIKKLERKKEAQARRTSSKIVGIKKKRVSEELNKDDKPFIQKLIGKLRKGSKTHAKQADDLEKTMKEESNPRIPRKKGQPAKSKKHSDLYTDEDPKGTIHGLGFKDVAKAKASVSKIRNSSRSHAHKIQAAVAMEQRAREMGKTSEAAVYRKYINAMKKKTKKMNEAANPAQQAAIAIDMKRKGKKPKSVKEETMTPAQKRKDTMLKKKYDKSDMKKSMQKQYGKEEGKKVYFATIRKQAMEGVEDDKYNVSEEGLRDWFGKSSGTTKSGRKVRGWVQVGGKYDGKPCARQPGQKSTPKCVSSAKRRSMSKSERDSAARRKRAADPNQPQKSGAAKPTNVSTDPKKKMSENYFNEAKDKKGKGSGTKDACYHKVKSRYSVWPSAYASGALVKCRKVGAANWGNKTKKEGFSPMQVSALEAAGMIEIKEGQKCWKGYEKKGTKMMFGKRYNNCVKKKSTKESVEFDEGMMDTVKTVGKKVLKKTKEFINKPIVEPTITGSQYKQQVQSGTTHKNVMDSVEPFAKVTEGVAFLKRKKEEKKKSSSEYLTQRDAGKLAKRKMAKKDQEKVNFLEPEETNESKTRLVKNGHTYKVVLTWRGKTYMVQMFVPSVSRPTRQEVEKEVQKLYPDAKVMSFLPRDLEPGEPTVMMGEEKHERDEYGDIVGGPKISKKKRKRI